MGLVILTVSDPPTPGTNVVATITFISICQEVARNLDAYESGTLTAVATTSMTAAVYPFQTSRTNASNKAYDACELYFTDGQFTPNPNEIAAYVASTGVFTPGVNWVDGGNNPTTFNIFKRGLKLVDIKQAVNEALRKRRYLSIVPLSLLADADCDESDAASWGTASNAAASKVQTAGNVPRGTRALRVLNSLANGYLPSANLSVAPGVDTAYYVEARVRSASGTAKLIIYDVTNSTEIESETWTDRAWGKISFNFEVPTTCKQIQARLGGTEATADSYWDDVILLRRGAREIPLPTYIVEEKMVRNVLISPEEDRADVDIYYPPDWWSIRPDASNTLGAYKLIVSPSMSLPLWIEASRPYATLAADTDTTFINQDWIETAATVELLRTLVQREHTEHWARTLDKWQKRLALIDFRYMPKPVIRWGFATPTGT